MVLAQGTQHLLLDEPTTYLDLAHAVDVMNVVHAAATSGPDRGRGAARPHPRRAVRRSPGGDGERPDRSRGPSGRRTDRGTSSTTFSGCEPPWSRSGERPSSYRIVGWLR